MTSLRHPETKTFYDRISHVYDLIADAGEHKARELGLRALDAQPGEQILEIGYGTGRALGELARAVGPDGTVCGIDISDRMHEIAAARLRDAGLDDRVDLRVGDVPPIPWDDARFDGVFMSFTLELFPDDELPEVLAEIRRVLKNGGRLCTVSMAKPREGEPDTLLEKTYQWLHRHFPHIVDCRPLDVARVLHDADFQIVKETRMDIWTLPVSICVAVR